ncbi:hypothetical protein B566_EDAN015142 [Ephemera danica]|nr:hypothetical protein B566_EDAN015142 [Ephemera danica]
MNNLFQADLCDMRSLSRYNNGFILGQPLKDKKACSIIPAMKNVFRIRKPLFLQTDKRKEFVAK